MGNNYRPSQVIDNHFGGSVRVEPPHCVNDNMQQVNTFEQEEDEETKGNH